MLVGGGGCIRAVEVVSVMLEVVDGRYGGGGWWFEMWERGGCLLSLRLCTLLLMSTCLNGMLLICRRSKFILNRCLGFLETMEEFLRWKMI